MTVPEQLQPLFGLVQERIQRYYDGKRETPPEGTIEVSGERFVMVRAASLSVDFFEGIRSLYRDSGPEEARRVASSFLYDISKSLGKSDASHFTGQLGIDDPLQRLVAGPLSFAFTGWASVAIHEGSRVTRDEDCLISCHHARSFEAEAWLRADKSSSFPVCVMSAGYSAGWAEESLGIGLEAVELSCRAMGDDVCAFIIAPPSRIEGHLESCAVSRALHPVGSYTVPEFFQRKRLEQELRAQAETIRTVTSAVHEAIVAVSHQGNISFWNRGAEEMFGVSQGEALGKDLFRVIAPARLEQAYRWAFRRAQDARGSAQRSRIVELAGRRRDREEFPIEFSLASIQLGGEEQTVCVMRDISERMRLAAELRHVYTVEAAGRATAGVVEQLSTPIVEAANRLESVKSEANELLTLLARYRDVAQQAAAGKAVGPQVEELLRLERAVNLGRLVETLPLSFDRIQEQVQQIAQKIRDLPRPQAGATREDTASI